MVLLVGGGWFGGWVIDLGCGRSFGGSGRSFGVELLSSFAVKTEDGTFCLPLRCLSCLIVASL